MIQSFKNVDESTRTLMSKTLAALFRAARNNIDTLLPAVNNPLLKPEKKHPKIAMSANKS